MSKALLDEFSSLGRVFAETREAIERVVGAETEIPALLHAAYQACIGSLEAEIRLRMIDVTDQRLIDYLVASMGSRPTEHLRALFLNRGNRLIGDEIVASGSISSLTVYPRNVVKRAIELSASGLILVHNHPGGNVLPSQSDIEFTHEMVQAVRVLEIAITDHIIIAGTQWFSFARQGLL